MTSLPTPELRAMPEVGRIYETLDEDSGRYEATLFDGKMFHSVVVWRRPHPWGWPKDFRVNAAYQLRQTQGRSS